MSTLSLGKAHKALQTIKEELRGLGRSPRRRFFAIDPDIAHRGTIQVEVPARGLQNDEIIEAAKRQIEYAKNALDRRLALEEDAGRLKEAIFQANQKSGVSERLTRQAFLEHRVSIFESLLREIADVGVNAITPDRLNEAFIREVREATSAENPSTTFTLVIADSEELREQIKRDRQELNLLDEEIRTLNATTTIKVKLHEVTRDLLGLN